MKKFLLILSVIISIGIVLVISIVNKQEIKIVSYTHSFNILDMYDSYTFDESSPIMSSVYTGPLVSTGGAMSDINRLIKNMEPTVIGSIEKNKITLIDTINEVYSFDSISYYNVIKGIDTFYVIKIIAKMNNENYDIIIELNDGPNYDRILNIYKKGKIKMMILWIGLENPRLRVKELKKI